MPILVHQTKICRALIVSDDDIKGYRIITHKICQRICCEILDKNEKTNDPRTLSPRSVVLGPPALNDNIYETPPQQPKFNGEEATAFCARRFSRHIL